MKILANIFAVLSILLIASSVSMACLCNVRSLAKRKSESRSVFVGTLIKRTQESQKGRMIWRNQFAIERYWKGSRADKITVYTTSDDCASWFETGQKYLVLAYFVKEDQHLETESCMGTGRIDMATEDLRKLGKGKLVATRTAFGDLRGLKVEGGFSVGHQPPFAMTLDYQFE